MNIRIREATELDSKTIESVTAAAFLNAAHTSHTEQLIVASLRAAGVLAVSLVAEIDGNIVGHVAASPVCISDRSAGWYGLGPVSVVPELQRRGIGTQLVRRALERLENAPAQGCVVLGDPAYYRRFGFVASPALILPGVPPEYFQVLSFRGSSPAGTVSYHQAFHVPAE